MKRLGVIVALVFCSVDALAYEPPRYLPPSYPVFVPPVRQVSPYVYARPGMPAFIPQYGYVPVYAAPTRPRLATPRDSGVEQQRDPKTRADTKPARVVEEPRKEPVRSNASRQAFLDMLLPIVERENARLRDLRAELKDIVARFERGNATEVEREQLLNMARRFRVQGNVLGDEQARRDLLIRVDIIPAALALAQAANESAWGTSRFAREGNNLFGIWTYDQSKGIVPKRRPEGARYLVRKFDSLDESVRYYLHTLNSHPAYQALRAVRAKARLQGNQPTAMALAGGLEKYSAKGELYVKLIRQLITQYQLAALEAKRPYAG